MPKTDKDDKKNFDKWDEKIYATYYLPVKQILPANTAKKKPHLVMAAWKETFYLLSGSCPTNVVPRTSKLIPKKAKVTLKRKHKSVLNERKMT